LKSYGTVTGAQQDMTTRVHVGTDTFAVRGLWRELTRGWKFTKKDVLLQPE
jgi:hypothetical protein